MCQMGLNFLWKGRHSMGVENTPQPIAEWVDERKNKIIMGKARVMLHDQGLPLHLWVESWKTTLYL